MSELARIAAKSEDSHPRRKRRRVSHWRGAARLATLFLFAVSMLSAAARAQVPVYKITPGESSIQFDVEASVAIKGTFKQWAATMAFKSRDPRTGVLKITIQADSVDTGSGIKNSKLKSKDFFDAKQNPEITFVSTKITQTGADTFDVEGDFTIRGVTRKETLTVKDIGRGKPSGNVTGTMAFDRKDYGMNSGIPFIKIANRVEVDIDLKWRRISGPPLVFQK